jgi:CTP synthase
MLQKEKLDTIVLEKLGLAQRRSNLSQWKQMVNRIHHLQGKVTIGMVGKYTSLKDAYLSIVEALSHSGYYYKKKVEIIWINSEQLNSKVLNQVDGILVPGGFGLRGIDGKINAITFARENKVPYLGICLGMQCAVTEFARNKLGLSDANSTEFDSGTAHPVIDLMVDQKGLSAKGGTMRLGKYPCRLHPGSLAYQAYGMDLIFERHRHRYELNNQYRDDLAEAGMIISGINPDQDLVEIVELRDHPWFVAVQFHPEFKSRPDRPHPLFRDFIGAALKYAKNK